MRRALDPKVRRDRLLGLRRLERLEKGLAKVKDGEFDLYEVGETVGESGSACATTACAIGWCPRIFPAQAKWAPIGKPFPITLAAAIQRFVVLPKGSPAEALRKVSSHERWAITARRFVQPFFALTADEANRLFVPSEESYDHWERKHTLAKVRANLCRFIERERKALGVA